MNIFKQSSRHDTQHNDTQHSDLQHNNTQCNDIQHDDTQAPFSLTINKTRHKAL